MPFRIGPVELGLILLIVIAVFGAGKLASLGGALGRGVKDFRSAMKDNEQEPKKEEEEPGESQANASATDDKPSSKE